MNDNSYFNISEMKLSFTSLYIISDAPKYDIIWTENNDVIDSFISEILKYKSWHKRSRTEIFTPSIFDLIGHPCVFVYLAKDNHSRTIAVLELTPLPIY